jgi:large subunit ribosomal protein L4
MATQVLNWKKEKVGTVELPTEIFATTVKKEILHNVVKWQLATRRAGTHMVKTKGLVSGGGKKPFKQKGTGNARQGSTRSPLMPGGGTMFGPEPRSYGFALPKKVRRLALSMALSYLNKEGRLFVVDQMDSKEGKTNELGKRLKGFGLKKAVLLDSEANKMFARATRNMKTFRYSGVEGMNVYDLLKYDAAIITKDSVAKIVERCSLENVR